MRLSDFDDWARSHHGIITFEASGLSRAAWYRAIRSGTIEQLHPHVARLHGTPDTPEQRIIAAVEAVGAGCLASHRSAARLWGVPRPDHDPVDILLPTKRRDVRLEGVVVHRRRDTARLVPQRRFAIACTDIARTLLDLGAVDPQGLHDAVGHVIANGLITLEALDAAATEHARPGRGGVVAVRDAIADWSIDDKPADSMLEFTFDRLARRHGLPTLEFRPIVEGVTVDARVRGTAVLLECDAWSDRRRDHERVEQSVDVDARLTAAGWTVVRCTYRAVTTRPSATAKRILAAIERHAATPAPDAA
jgi:very-short-patch-repair endonuclease